MRKVNASFTTIAAALVSAAIVFPARADDYGPHPDVRAVRGSLPVMLLYPLKRAGAGAAVEVDDVVVSGDYALATWHTSETGARYGAAILTRRSARWWLTANANTVPAAQNAWSPFYRPAGALAECGEGGRRDGPTAADIAAESSPALAALAARHAAITTHSTPYSNGQPSVCFDVTPSPADNQSASEGGLATLGPGPFPQLRLNGRAPTVAEMPPATGMNAYYFFRLSSNGSAPIPVHGATLDVWFPYVLDANRGYALWLDFLKPDIDGLGGTLHDNVLHFVLPDFETIPGKEAFGEIDGA